MALPSSPPIDLRAIQIEFGAPAGTDLLALRRGGAYVPNTPANANVPTAAPISVLDFLGATASAPLTASATPTYLVGFGTTETVTTAGSATCTAEGGSGTLAYSWERVSGSTKIYPVNTGSATTEFRGINLITETVTAVFRCKVTRGTETAYSNNVNVEIERG